MNTIGECCDGGQMPQPKVAIRTPQYMAMYNNPTVVSKPAVKKPVPKLARKGR